MKNKAEYDIDEPTVQSLIEEPAKAYSYQNFDLIRLSRQGVLKKTLLQLVEKLSFSLQEVSCILRVSERTLQRYKKGDILAPDTSGSAI